jgi:hypothetical protein
MRHRSRPWHSRASLWLLTSSLAAGLMGQRSVQAVGQVPAPPGPVVLRADSTGVVLEWRAPAFSLRRVAGEDGDTYSAVEIPGWPKTDVPGQPRLPFATALAVVPPTGDVTMHMQVLNHTHRPLPHPVVPARAPVPVGDPPISLGWEWARDERAYGGRGLRPADAVTLEEAGWQRGRRLVRLTFYPLRFDPAGSALEVTNRVRVELRFDGQPLDVAQGESADAGGWDRDDPFISVLQTSVVNPAQVNRFARPRQSTPAAAAAPGVDTTPDGDARYKLIVRRERVYALTYDALVAAGVPVDTTPRPAYRLEHAGEEVAYQWEGDGDGVFEAGERILFYARPTPTRFADYDVYWLTPGASGTFMTTRSGNPSGLPPATAWTTVIAEQGSGGQHYLARYPSGWDGDRWYWDRLYWDATTATGEREKEFTITLDTPDGGAPNATLRVYLQGTTHTDAVKPDHRVQVRLNGSLLGTAEWDGAAFHVATFNPPASLVRAGSNTVRLRLPGNGAPSGVEEVWLDAIQLRYGIGDVAGRRIRVEGEAGQNRYTIGADDVRIYDVTNPAATQIVTDFPPPSSGKVTFGDVDAGTATYYLLTEDQIAAPDRIVPALTLPDPPGGAEYLVIAHSDFADAVAPLVAHRAVSQTVFSATVEAVYDVYSYGVVTSTAIRDYIEHAYEDWPTPVKYVLLVGDGIRDSQSRLQSPVARMNYIPPYMMDVGGFEAASDNRYVTVDGDDNLADVFIGRLPVNTVAEATTVVDKILAYELDAPQWPWNERVLFFADDDYGGIFHQDSDEILTHHLPSNFVGRRVYYCSYQCNKSHLYDDITAAHDAVMRELNVGGLLASYVGHSSVHQWAVERMFHLDDVAALHNGAALPMFLEMTCYTSDFSDPALDTLDESLLRWGGGGAIATWGSTTLGSTAGHASLHQTFFDTVFQNGSTARLGPATEAAKTSLPGDSDLRDTFVLLGDPAMDLNLAIVPWAHEVFLPFTLRDS